jgi:thioredoxin reductase (NADPH)
MDLFDITIIGAGPVGLYGTYYAGLRGMKTKLIDALPQLGGQLTALYPEKYIYDVAGFPKILSKDLSRNLVEQSLQYNPEVCLNEKVIGLQHINEDGQQMIKLTTEPGREHFTKTVVLCCGVGAFVPRKLDIPDTARLEGRGIVYFVSEKAKYAGKDILIVGGGDSAVDWALNLEGIARKITLTHRRDQFRAHEDSVRQLMQSSVDIKVFYELKAVLGDEHVEGAIIFSNKTREEMELKVDYILLNLGFLANLGPIKQWGLSIDKNSIIVTTSMETNLSGVYAAGDIIDYSGKLKLISTGVGDAAVAVNNAKHFIDPAAKVFPGHSSDMTPPPPKMQ